MADGSRSPQQAFHFPNMTATSRLRPGEIVVDLFAGGGGASHALETALARAVDIAINHNPWAIGMHAANHPYTRHLCEDVWAADPVREVMGRRVGWLHASPDCTHFSQAKGGQPRDRATRSLSWVVLKWAGRLRRRDLQPRVISLENVEQILKWGPLVAKRDKTTGRVLKLDGTVAARGERVPLDQQFLVPDKRREGKTWRQFVRALRALGYAVEWSKLRACDYGAGTSRQRLFMVARCDGEPICWPAPTHGPGRETPYVTAADSIDWGIPCPSIFERRRPLADATLRRIARGVRRYVLDSAEPFIVGVGGRMGQTVERSTGTPMQTLTAKADACVCSPTLVECANASADGTARADLPLRTITAWPKGGAHAVAAPLLVQVAHGEGKPDGVKRWGTGARSAEEPTGTVTASGSGGYALAAPVLVQTGYGEREGQAPRSLDLAQPLGVMPAGGVKHAIAAAALVKFRGESDGGTVADPLPTITSGAGAARPAGAAHALGVIAAHLEQANGGFYVGDGRSAGEPLSTITSSGTQQRLVAANMVTMRGDNIGAPASDPLRTLTAGGEHHGVVACTLSPEHEAGALRVAAFLLRYYGMGGQHGELDDPVATITTKDRLALVTVAVQGVPHVIVDIGLRMLQRHELFRAQGFPPEYVIDRTADGTPLSASRSVSMVGNSVSPPPLRAIVIANLDPAGVPERMAA